MSNAVKVKRIVLNINGKEIPLTLDEAKELSKVLGEMFEEKTVVREVVRDRWHYPYVWYEYSYPGYWTATVSSTGTATLTTTTGDNITYTVK